MKNARVDGLPLPHESLYSSKFNWKNLAIGRALIACAASTAYVAWYHQNPDKEEDTDHTYEISIKSEINSITPVLSIIDVLNIYLITSIKYVKILVKKAGFLI